MAAPKGNKYAVGARGGRPTEWTKDKVDDLIAKLYAWADKPDSLIFPQFCLDAEVTLSQLNYLIETDNEFSEAFFYTRCILAERITKDINKDSLHPSVYNRYARYYDKFLGDFEQCQYGVAVEEAARHVLELVDYSKCCSKAKETEDSDE